MRKKYLYSSYSPQSKYRGVDVVSELFSDYYFGVKQTVNLVDTFLLMNKYMAALFLISFVFAIVLISLKLLLLATVMSLTALLLLVLLIVKWFAFKYIFFDLKENQIF